MPITQNDMIFAATQQSMSDEEFLQASRVYGSHGANDEQQIAINESAATRRFSRLATGTTITRLGSPANPLSAPNEW